MAAPVKIMRSQLGRVRGLGSAQAGTEHWYVARVAAAALAPLSLWFVYSVLSLLGAEQPVVAAWAGRPVNAALLLSLVVLTFRHMQLGLQAVYEDYLRSAFLRTTATVATAGLGWVMTMIGSLAVVKLFLSAH